MRAALVAAALLLQTPCAAALRTQRQAGSPAASRDAQADFPAARRMLRPGVVHFMFELKDHLQHPGIWGKFFSQAMQGSYMAWAHCTDYHACENDYMMKKVKVRLVPQVFSVRGADLINPFAHMIRLALKETRHLAERGVPEKFLVISDATLPVKPFAFIHWDLISRDNSDICISIPTQWAKATIGGIPLALVKHHQWLALNRTDAKALADDWTPLKKIFTWNMTLRQPQKWGNLSVRVNRHTFKDGAWFTATDEEVPYQRAKGPVVLSHINDTRPMWQLFNARTCITYVDWPDNVWPPSLLDSHTTSLLQTDAHLGHTYNFTNDVTLKLLKDPTTKFTIAKGIMHPFMWDQMGDAGLSVFRSSQYLFARKFSPCAHMPNFTEIMFSE